MERLMILSALNVVVVMLLAPLLIGVINRTKSLMGGRQGPPLFQLYYDIAKLLQKRTVLSETTTWIFLAGPVISVATSLVAMLFLPFGNRTSVISFTGDMLLFIYLFALARFFVATAAMDTGSSFEGMGASREVTFSALAEPALLLGLLALARVSGSLNLSDMLAVESSGLWKKASASAVLIVISWFIVLIAENSRVPVDDPNTHLELTMIHEVMVLDHGGPAFGLIQYGASLKLSIFCALLASLILPLASQQPLLHSLLIVAGILSIGIIIGLVESIMARLRLVRIPQLLITSMLLAAFAVVLLLR
jgi:formate hydrogenlyase subunit 4